MSRFSNNFTMDAVRDFWDKLARHEYENANERMNRVHTQRFREAIKRLSLRSGDRLLNVWSRVGDGIPFLRDSCSDIELVNAELSHEMLKVSRCLNPGENHVQSSLHELPFSGCSFDKVMSLETLEHVPDPLLLLVEIRRILIPGGVLVMSLPPSTAEWTSWINTIVKFHHGEGPHRFLSPRRVKQMLDESGLTLVDYTGTLFLPFGGMNVEALDLAISRIIGKTFLGQLGMRTFYVCKKPV